MRKLFLLICLYLLSCAVPQGQISPVFQNARRVLHVSTQGTETGNGSKGMPFRSIQEAINRAQKGDVVWVAPGIYRGNITLRSHIRLIGSGADETTLNAEQGAILTVQNAIDVTIEGFTLDGQDTALHGLFCNNELFYSAGLSLSKSQGKHPPVVFRKNVLKNFIADGIYGENIVITVEENVLTSIRQIGIHLTRTQSKVKGNHISFVTSGIVIRDHHTEILENTVTNFHLTGIFSHNNQFSFIKGNEIIGGEEGIAIESTPATVLNNRVVSLQGIHCKIRANPKLRRNIIEGKKIGIFIDSSSSADLGREGDFGYNTIRGESEYAVQNESEKEVLAIGNWWGAAPMPEKFKGKVDYGQPLE